MEPFNSILGIPYVFHCGIVSVVFVGAVLLFVFGFKSTEEPSFNKIKADSKSISKKKKKKEKKLVNGNPNLPENKNKGNSTPKPRTKNNEEKSRKANALKDSKTINLNSKALNKELGRNDKRKNKGKENMDALSDFDVEEGLWEALSRKKNRKNQNLTLEVSKGNDKKSPKGSKGKKAKVDGNEIKDKDSSLKVDRKLKDDDGDWQEAKSSKKRRKIQKED